MNNTPDLTNTSDSEDAGKLTQVRVKKKFATIIRVQAAQAVNIYGEDFTRQRWLEMAIVNQQKLDDQLLKERMGEAGKSLPNLVAA